MGIETFLFFGNNMKLNLGCGSDYRDGNWLNIDNKQQNNETRCDITADFTKIEFPNNSVDEILASHVIVYIDRKEMPNQLKKWYRWLKPDGKLTIESGDLTLVMKYIQSNLDDPSKFEGVYGVMQLFGWEGSAGHKWAWCKENLEPLLKEAKFRNIIFGEGTRSQYSKIRDFKMTCMK